MWGFLFLHAKERNMFYRFRLYKLIFILCLLCPSSELLAGNFVGLHSHGMGGAHRGLGTSNDTLFLNPAGMSMSKRYTIEGVMARDLRDESTVWGVSAVDSKSGPIAGGIGWLMERTSAEEESLVLNRFVLGLSFAPLDFLSIGFNSNYFTGDAHLSDVKLSDLSHFSGDIGLSVKFLESFGLGFSSRNILSSKESEYLPMITAFGFGFRGIRINAAADLVWNKDVPDDESLSYHAGLEYFAKDVFPLRLGYRRAAYHRKDETLAHENVLSAGLAWVSMGGSFEFAYQQSIERPGRKDFSFGMKFFL